jgi:alpha-galactosidase
MKISLIGAGSGAFSLSLIRDICLTENLNGCTVSFMDVNPERLDGSYHVCQRYAAELGRSIKFEKTLIRKESLAGADFVVNTALAAGHNILQAGWKIAQQHGYRWGGSLAIMHDEAFWINYYQLRLFESIAEDILTICPNAWYLQVANSVLGGSTHLTRKYPKLKIAGLCHGHNGVYSLVNVLGLDRNSITYEAPGVNHFIWLTKLFYHGENIMPLWDRWVEEEAKKFHRNCGDSHELGPKPIDIYKRFGAMPIGDTATVGGGAWGHWYHTDEITEKKWQENPALWWQGYFNGVEKTARENFLIGQDSSARISDYISPKMSGESMVPIIESITCNIPRIFIVNVANKGAYVPGVPHDFCVEIPALVSKHGIQGLQTDELPNLVLQLLLRDRVVPWEIELDAFARGNRRELIELISLDPWTNSLDQAESFLTDLLEMPALREMKSHYN